MCRVLCRDAHISVHPLYITNPFHVFCVGVLCVVLVGAGVAALFTINFNARAERSVLEYNNNSVRVSPARVARLDSGLPTTARSTSIYPTAH